MMIIDKVFASFVALAVAGCGGFAAAQGGGQVAVQPAPAVAVLGEVEAHAVPLGEHTTLFDAVIAAKVQPTGDRTRLLLVRCAPGDVLTLRVDFMKMIKTGDTTQNVLLQNGDLLFVPARRLAGAADVELVDRLMGEARPGELTAAHRARVAAWRLLVEKDPARRHEYVTGFGALAANGGEVVEPLAAALAGDVAIARDVAVALGMLGAAGKPALPALAKAIERGDGQLRERAKAAVRQIEAALAPRQK